MVEEEQTSFKPHYLTISEIRQMYRQQDTLLNADTILATLEPLTGTSFLQHATEIHRHTVSVSMIAYNDEKRGLQMFTQLSEGNKPHRFFSDVNRPPLPFIDPRQTSFLRTSPLLYISPQFSLEKAQPRRSL